MSNLYNFDHLALCANCSKPCVHICVIPCRVCIRLLCFLLFATWSKSWSKQLPCAEVIAHADQLFHQTFRNERLCQIHTSQQPKPAARMTRALVPLCNLEKSENSHPCVGVCPLVLPSLQYLQAIKSHCSSHPREWIPWRKILSEAAAVKLLDKKKYAKPSDAWEYVAQRAPAGGRIA